MQTLIISRMPHKTLIILSDVSGGGYVLGVQQSSHVCTGSTAAIRANLFWSPFIPLITEVKIGNLDFALLTSAYPTATVVN